MHGGGVEDRTPVGNRDFGKPHSCLRGGSKRGRTRSG
jgi:hypothetical protein